MHNTRPGLRVEERREMRRRGTGEQVRPFVLDYLIGHVHLAIGDPVTAGKYLTRAAHKEIATRAHDP